MLQIGLALPHAVLVNWTRSIDTYYFYSVVALLPWLLSAFSPFAAYLGTTPATAGLWSVELMGAHNVATAGSSWFPLGSGAGGSFLTFKVAGVITNGPVDVGNKSNGLFFANLAANGIIGLLASVLLTSSPKLWGLTRAVIVATFFGCIPSAVCLTLTQQLNLCMNTICPALAGTGPYNCTRSGSGCSGSTINNIDHLYAYLNILHHRHVNFNALEF